MTFRQGIGLDGAGLYSVSKCVRISNSTEFRGIRRGPVVQPGTRRSQSAAI